MQQVSQHMYYYIAMAQNLDRVKMMMNGHGENLANTVLTKISCRMMQLMQISDLE